MKIIIDIPEDYYKIIKHDVDKGMDYLPCVLIAEGTPLQKRHTELVNRQIIADYVHSHIQEINTGYGDLNQHTNRILRMIEDYIDNAPTIIEAESEEEE